MVISLWMILVVYLIISSLVFIGILRWDDDLMNEGIGIKILVFMMSMLMTALGLIILSLIGKLLIVLFNEIISTDWGSFFNREIIYIK